MLHDDLSAASAQVVHLDAAGQNPPPPDKGARAPTPGGKGGGKRQPKKVDFGVVSQLVAHFALIYGTDTAWDGSTRRIIKVSTMRLAFGGDAVKFWLGSDNRRTVLPEDLVFEPGRDVEADGRINLFEGLPVKPQPCADADVAPMLELLHHLCACSASTDEGVAEVMSWVLRWLAYPLQHLGAKMRTALVFHGPQGTGKNLFFDVVRGIYGRYGVMVGQNELEDKFNDWLSAKLFVIGNEVVTRSELYHHKNKLKWLITEEMIPIRAMQQSVRWESNHAQVVFLSNEQQPLALEEGDRRYLVVYTPTARDKALYDRVAQFIQDGGAAKFMHYLMQIDLRDFGEHTKPIMTQAKADLIELGLKPGERFAGEWLGGLLPLPLVPCGAEQLYRAFRKWCDMTGERFPPPQTAFTMSVQRYVVEQAGRTSSGEPAEPRLHYKVVQLKHDLAARKAMRCWLPRGTGPLAGVSEGEWAKECIDEFERHLERFGRVTKEAET